MDEDARQHEELREQYNLQERRLSLLQTELEEVRSALEGSERSRKLLEQEVVEITERHNEVNVQVGRWLPGKCHGNSYSGCQSQSRMVSRPVSSLRIQRQLMSSFLKSSKLTSRTLLLLLW